MVADPRAAPGPDRLRALNVPVPLPVRADDAGRPRAVVERGETRRVEQIEEEWKIEEEWWRDPISRHYFRVTLETGIVRTLFRDQTDDRWYAQAY